MKKQEFEKLKAEVLDLVKETIVNSEPELYDYFKELSGKVLELSNKKSIEKAFKGILGFRYWCVRIGGTDGDFARNGFHDLKEIVRNHDKAWFSPRTRKYIKVWECVNAKLW